MSAANAEQFYQRRPKDEARGHRGQAKSFTNLSKSSIIFHPADSSKGAKVYKFLFEPLRRCRLPKLCEKAREKGADGIMDQIKLLSFFFQKNKTMIKKMKKSLAKKNKVCNVDVGNMTLKALEVWGVRGIKFQFRI